MRYADVLKHLNKHRIDYLVTGSVALICHGVEKVSVTLDLMVNMQPQNMTRFVRSMREIGYEPLVPEHADQIVEHEGRSKFRRPVLTFYNNKEKGLVDVCLNEKLDYDHIKSQALVYDACGLSVPVVCLSDLIELKTSTGKWRDVRDVMSLTDTYKLSRATET